LGMRLARKHVHPPPGHGPASNDGGGACCFSIFWSHAILHRDDLHSRGTRRHSPDFLTPMFAEYGPVRKKVYAWEVSPAVRLDDHMVIPINGDLQLGWNADSTNI